MYYYKAKQNARLKRELHAVLPRLVERRLLLIVAEKPPVVLVAAGVTVGRG